MKVGIRVVEHRRAARELLSRLRLGRSRAWLRAEWIRSFFFLCCAAAVLGLAAGCVGGPEPDDTVTVGGDLQAAPCPPRSLQQHLDPAGLIESDSTNAFDPGPSGGFFADLGTNGRTCNTCHVVEDGWTITPGHARGLPPHDPLFTPNDGSDCPPTSPSQRPQKALSSQLLNFGLIRIQLGIPTTAGYSLVSASNPQGCAIAPGSSEAGGQLFLFRRPLPTTNLIFDSTIMWDGRESLQKVTTTAGFQGEAPLLFDLNDQANSATTGHAQGGAITGTPAQADIVAFETSLTSAQSKLGLQPLDARGANGGAQYLAEVVAPAFAVGVNDPLQPGFSNADFTIYQAWEPTSPHSRSLDPLQKAIGRGEAIFNNTTFVIHDVPGLNSAPTNPLYNPADPLAGQDLRGGCAVCHNSPNVGNHSSPLAINIGVTMAQPVNNDGSPNQVLDLAQLPVYTLSNGVAQVKLTDPGRALISGNWTDLGKTKGPNLRGLAARAPYFHNGSAKDLRTVVRFYNDRFDIGLREDQIADLVAFLSAL
jgi:cytochrome c peroxidase